MVPKVNMMSVQLEVLRPWVTKTLQDILGFEDEVVQDFVMSLLEGNEEADKAEVGKNLKGFLEDKTPAFVDELWELLIDAEKNASEVVDEDGKRRTIGGVPTVILEAKKEEIRKQTQAKADLLQKQLDEQNQLRQQLTNGNDDKQKSSVVDVGQKNDPAKKQREDGKQKGDRASPSQMSRRRQPEPAGRDLSPRRNRNRSRSESRDRSASKWRKMERSPRRRYNRSPDRWRRDRSVSRGKDRSYSRSRSRSIDRRRSRSPGDSRDRSRSPAVRRRARSRSPLYRRRRYSRSLSREDFRVRGGVRGGYGRRNEPRPNRRRRSPSPFVKRSRGQRGERESTDVVTRDDRARRSKKLASGERSGSVENGKSLSLEKQVEKRGGQKAQVNDLRELISKRREEIDTQSPPRQQEKSRGNGKERKPTREVKRTAEGERDEKKEIEGSRKAEPASKEVRREVISAKKLSVQGAREQLLDQLEKVQRAKELRSKVLGTMGSKKEVIDKEKDVS